MNEKIKKAGIAFAIILLIFAAGFLGGRFSRSGELRAVEEQLGEARGYSDQLGERLANSGERIDGLEALANSRQETIGELKEDLQFSIARARERDKIIAGLESRVGGLTEYTAELREITEQSKSIVDELLGQGVSD